MTSNNSSKFKVLLEFKKSVRGVLLPINISYLNLVNYVKKKYEITDKSVSLHYITASRIIDVRDDADVSFFVKEICCKQTMVQTLFIKVIEQTLEVNRPSPSKPLDIDLNVSLFPEECDNQTPAVENEKNEPVGENVNVDVQARWQNCTFQNIPIPPHAPDPIIKIVNTLKHSIISRIKKGNHFDDKEVCIFSIGIKAVVERFEYLVIKSNKSRYDVNCIEEGCNWSIHTRKSIISRKFYVSSINDVHTCSRTRINPNHRNATQKLLGRILFEKLKDSRRIYTGKDIIKDLNIDWKIDVSYKRAWGGKNIALQMVNGCPKESFEQLPYYCYNLKLENEGTVTHIETDDEDRFKMLFIGFGFAIRSFLGDMRPLIIIDAAHLKGRYLGTNIVAVGMDGNNQIIPIATGVCQGETNETWTWFMSKLKGCIGEVKDLAIISDRHAAIAHACRTVFPNTFHGFCCRHLMMNCRLKSKKWKAIYWRTCKTYTEKEFDDSMAEIRGSKPDVYKKLAEAGFGKWSRAYCPAKRYNYLTSNSAESVNSLTAKVRKVPITNLMEYYRRLLQQWYFERREKYKDAPKDELTDWAAAKVNDRMVKSANWVVNGIEMFKLYQVTDSRHVHIVDFHKRECSCKKWQLSGLPCGHVCAVSRSECLNNNSSWALSWFKKTALKKTYQERVYPLKDMKQWLTPADLQIVKPPLLEKRQAGRPKEKDRIRSQGEEPKSSTCTRCHKKGHTRTACNVPLVPNKKRRRTTESSSPAVEDSVVDQQRRDRMVSQSTRLFVQLREANGQPNTPFVWNCQSSTPRSNVPNNSQSQPGSSTNVNGSNTNIQSQPGSSGPLPSVHLDDF